MVGPYVPSADAQRPRIEPLRPDRPPRRGCRWRDHREVLGAIAWRFQTGSRWVHLPERYGNWRGLYDRLRTWATNSTVGAVLTPCPLSALGLRSGHRTGW
ncbi:hypothetical protein BKD26_31510 [Streptomyces sp. CB03238]|nr:hypothetical protein BKD26_31510 [Streptomyces sp. CB03238]